MGHYGHSNTNIKPLIINTGVLGVKQDGGTYMPIVLGNGTTDAGNTTNPDQIALSDAYRDSCISDKVGMYRYNIIDGVSYGMVIKGENGGSYIFCVHGVSTVTFFIALLADTHYFHHSSNGSDWISDGSVTGSPHRAWRNRGQITSNSNELHIRNTSSLSDNSSNNYQYYLVNANDKTFIPNITDEDILYNRGVGLQTQPENLSAEITAGNYIVFQGDGELHVTVKPVSQITHAKPNGVAAITNITSDQIIKISPETHLYEEQSDGTYKITLSLNNVAVSNLEPVIGYSKLRMPKMSRCIDFSKRTSDNRFLYNVCGNEYSGVNNFILYSDKNDGTISRTGIRWNATIDNWEYYANDGSTSKWNWFRCQNYSGDMYLVVDAAQKKSTQLRFGWRGKEGIWEENINCGTCRYFHLFEKMVSNYSGEVSGDALGWEVRDITDASSLLPIIGGITLPINSVLYSGVKDGVANEGVWYGDAYDASAACKKVTEDACAKLKSDHKENLRIYVVKYRKQDGDYDYIDKCATTSSYVYDAADEASLNVALQQIATDIRENFADYKPAQNK
jgi:hypothetical protein